ncbi:hypothetical protein DEU56DRAFT_916271 [Suillus clintonianus]|uniref:uncharacterized protein n=1 Tax=Suillus clintonianus TaxID=1904413 RepID=UPI001B85E912|nr:uncharacterized protein DEU56DRAFT_916271 [Suillus clintonianus]KAG2125991.1 hypothetical protein DEU56DRAFT_916271 [Suillus clintonianus]
MPRPTTRPGNANKHPGQVVLDANRVSRPKDVIAAEKNKKVAAEEDAMAVEQMVQRTGPERLVRPKPKPRPVTKKQVSTLEDATQIVNPETSVGAKSASQNADIQKKKHPGLKLTFKDGVNASRKVSNSGLSALKITLYYFDVFHSLKRRASESSIPSERGGVAKWAKSVASKSQLKPSTPPSTRGVVANDNTEWLENDNAPEEFDDSVTRNRRAQSIVHMVETVNNAPRGKKRALSAVSVEDLGPEEQCEMQEDNDADEDDEYQDVDDDVVMMDQEDDLEVYETTTSRLTTSMSVGVVETDNQSSKYIKTETGRTPLVLNLKKEKPKNAHLPSGALNSNWCSKFLPTIMYWIGNSNYPWTIPDDTLSDTLDNIYLAVYNQPGDFEVDSCNGAFSVVGQRISEWRGNFGSVAVTILMAFFASMDEYETQDEDSPGAFFSEFILRTFAAHLGAIQGRQKVDTLDFGLPGYGAALAMTAAAAERALILARDDLILEDTSGQGKHKIALTLNQATNKMSHTGTAFSAGNWETDTIAYMELIEQLPFDRIQEIIARSQPYIKRTRRRGQDGDTGDGDSQLPINPRSRIRICSVFSFS